MYIQLSYYSSTYLPYPGLNTSHMQSLRMPRNTLQASPTSVIPVDEPPLDPGIASLHQASPI